MSLVEAQHPTHQAPTRARGMAHNLLGRAPRQAHGASNCLVQTQFSRDIPNQHYGFDEKGPPGPGIIRGGSR